jgi:hypothetical protein
LAFEEDALGGDASFLAFEEEDELALGGVFFFGVTIEAHKLEGISLFEYNWESISNASFISTNRS